MTEPISRRMTGINHTLSSSLFWSGVFLLLAATLLVILKMDWELYVNLVEEGAATERLSAIFYLVSGILLLIAAVRVRRGGRPFRYVVLTILLGLFFIFIAGEEESWGQWIFDYEVSEEIQEVNVQNETNIHNLGVFSLLNPHRILLLFVTTIGILVPLAYRFSQLGRRLLNRWFFAVCPLALAGPFFIAMVFEKVAYAMHDHWAHAEAMEFLFACAILLYGISVFRGENVLPDRTSH